MSTPRRYAGLEPLISLIDIPVAKLNVVVGPACRAAPA